MEMRCATCSIYCPLVPVCYASRTLSSLGLTTLRRAAGLCSNNWLQRLPIQRFQPANQQSAGQWTALRRWESPKSLSSTQAYAGPCRQCIALGCCEEDGIWNQNKGRSEAPFSKQFGHSKVYKSMLPMHWAMGERLEDSRKRTCMLHCYTCPFLHHC